MTARRDFLRRAGAMAAGSTALLASGVAVAAPAGPRVLRGTAAPSRRTGRVGDFFLDARRGRLYGPKTRVKRRPWGTPTRLAGLTGPAGPAGPAGAPGAPGAPGGPGAAGPRGYGVLSGAGAPSAATGADGDFYLDTATTQIYGPRTGGVWGSPTNLTGPAAPSDHAVYAALAAAPELLLVGPVTRNASGVPTTGSVRWPDGTPGTFSTTASAAVDGAVDAYVLTYGATRSYRQPAVTRDPQTGAVTDRPAIVVT